MGNVCIINVLCDAIFSRFLDCTVRKVKYVSELEDNLAALQSKLQKLIEARNDVMRRIVIAEQQQMKRLHQVEGWLSRVQPVEIEVDELQDVKSREIDKFCPRSYCPSKCKSRYEFGEKVAKTLRVLDDLKGEGDFKDVAERTPEDPVDERPIEPTIVGLESTLEEVWRCLQCDSIGIIGICGMEGVGKTTLLTQINNKFLHTQTNFDVVIWVVVSKDIRLEKIQENIGKRLGLSQDLWKNKSFQDKATDIFKILRWKKFALLLDDVWERIDLTMIGVPPPSPIIASKVVFTTRLIDVCAHMEAHTNFRLKCLAYDDAWKLFQMKVGRETLDYHPYISKLAEILVQECGGLPLALVTIGRAMTFKKTLEEWNYAIQVLTGSDPKFLCMGKEVHSLLKFCCDSLPNDVIRSCFLYCSLFPEDYSNSKRNFIECWIGGGLLADKE